MFGFWVGFFFSTLYTGSSEADEVKKWKMVKQKKERRTSSLGHDMSVCQAYAGTHLQNIIKCIQVTWLFHTSAMDICMYKSTEQKLSFAGA